MVVNQASFLPNNRDVACYLVTKHSWKGKYKRVFSIGTLAITTYNPQTLEITNQWPYENFVAIKPSPKSQPQSQTGGPSHDEFLIHIRLRGKNDTMRFSSDYTADILTETLTFYSKFTEDKQQPFTVSAYKQDWAERRIPVTLRVAPSALEQVDKRGVVVAAYKFKNIRSITKVEDYPGGFVLDVGEHRRRHLFASPQADDLIREMKRAAEANIGVVLTLSSKPVTVSDFVQTRLGLCSSEAHLTSYVEFNVQKFATRHETPVRRILCLSESCLVERDPTTYMPICATPLKHIICLVRLDKDPQQFAVEYENGDARAYAAAERDLILASLVDGIRASGNSEVFVTGHRFDRALRLLPHGALLDEDGESQAMRHIIAPPPGLKRTDLIRRFNANIPYNGLTYSVVQEGFFTENKGKVIVGCLEAVLSESYNKEETAGVHKCEAQLQCLHRLFASKSGFQAFTAVPGVRETLGKLVIAVLKWAHEATDYACVEMLSALMQPMHANYELRTEQLNKQSLLASKAFVEHLLDLVVRHVDRGTGSLVIAAMLDFLTYAVCAPYSETTSGETFDTILELVAARGRSFYKLFQSPSFTIVKGAGMVMRAIIEESTPEISKQMQTLALTEGAFLSHLHMALLTGGKDLRVMTNRQLSGHLISLWIAENQPALELLARSLPRGLLNFLDSTEPVPVRESDLLLTRNNLEVATQEQRQSALKEQLQQFQVAVEAKAEQILMHLNLEHRLSFLRTSKNDKTERPVVLRRRRQRVASKVNWQMFAYQFRRDHAKADLIWNEKTREEFRQSVDSELRVLRQEKDSALGDTPVAWNHTEFQTRYTSLNDEVKIGDYYLRLLLQENDENATPIHNPCDFFNNVYHRFLLSARSEMRCVCLRAMAVTYERHSLSIGAFADAKYLVGMLSKCTNAAERDHLVLLLSKLVLNRDNCRELLLAGVTPLLVDMAALAHLHTGRAVLSNQTNAIEIGKESAEGGSKEWYYNDKKDGKVGPVSFEQMKQLYTDKVIFEKTVVWAQGIHDWLPLSSVPQFRWTLLAEKAASTAQPGEGATTPAAPLFNFTQLCEKILDIFIQMCAFFPTKDENGCVIRPLPMVKKNLTDPSMLYPVVSLLLTYDPQIVTRVATLLLHVMEDNPYLSRLYLSGVFFFILMYNGSNVLPIARFLYATHLKQAFRSPFELTPLVNIPVIEYFEATLSQSVLAPILPEAATFYLEEYGPDKYAEVYLGEFDNPEIIWNTEMRSHMINQIAQHIGEFTVRLTSNIKAMYTFTPITRVSYPELERELFCHVYYLRHLCDRQRFPDWPIRDPIPFLQSCLQQWFDELNKKAPPMSIDAAAQALELKGDEWKDPKAVVRAYRKLSLQFHPDKNPDGRDRFDQINIAYQLLTSGVGQGTDPDTNRIVLCLRAQSIIYERYLEELAPQKYAGYPQLIKTIAIEAEDEQLFSKGGGALLSAAVELAEHTLRSSALNAEELRREKGLEALQLAFDRCAPMVNLSTKPDDMCAEVCEHICLCVGTAARFEGCRERLTGMPTLFGNLCNLLQFSDPKFRPQVHLTRLASAAADCICALAVDTLLQTQLFQTGVLWQLLPHLFHFDYTLDEGGVTHSEATNKQTLRNRLARASCEALASLAGFRENCPENDGVINSLRALLTPYICRCMREGDNDNVLKLLNTNTENPYLIWDNATRAELLDFVEMHRTSKENMSDLFGAEFRLSVYAKELIVGDVFIRIYNEQPNFVLTEPKKTCVDFLDYLAKEATPLVEPIQSKKTNGDLIDIDWSAAEKSNGNAISVEVVKIIFPIVDFQDKIDAVLQALANLLVSNPGVEMLLIGHFALIFALLRPHPSRTIPSKLQLGALRVASLAAQNRECVTDLASQQKISAFLALTITLREALPTVLQTLIALSSNANIVKELLECGGILYILSIFCDSRADPGERLATAELLAKLQADKLSGPRWTRFLTRYLPPIFADALRDAPQTAITMFDSVNENPELIWNERTRDGVKDIVQRARDELFALQRRDFTAKWNTNALNSECAYAGTLTGEIVVAGVFLRLFVANPGWQVRHPRQFATELMEKLLELMGKPSPDLELVRKAFCALLQHHPSTADQLPAQGYLPQFCAAMLSKDAASSEAAIYVLRQLADNSFCADALAKLNVVDGIHKSMRNQPTLMRESAHALKCLMAKNTGELAARLLSSGLVDFLLDVLGGRMNGVEQAAAARAEIVDALKQACLDPTVGDKIAAQLKASPIWSQFADQRHDLFLPAPRTQAIAGPTSSGVAGYLTDSMFNPPPMTHQPPPLPPPPTSESR